MEHPANGQNDRHDGVPVLTLVVFEDHLGQLTVQVTRGGHGGRSGVQLAGVVYDAVLDVERIA